MPLSDHEQRLLEQMERALYEDDPKFASSLRSGHGGSLNRTRIALGSLGAVAGLVIVVVGVAIATTIVGVVGFAVMVTSAFWAWTGTRGEGPVPTTGSPATPGASRSKGTQSAFMTRMEERWRQRREGGDSHF